MQLNRHRLPEKLDAFKELEMVDRLLVAWPRKTLPPYREPKFWLRVLRPQV